MAGRAQQLQQQGRQHPGLIDGLPADDRFTVMSSTCNPHPNPVEMLVARHSHFSAFMFVPRHMQLVLIDCKNDECLYSIMHGPEWELE
jgi:hypothetical protein